MKNLWIVFAEVVFFLIIHSDAQVTLSRAENVMIIGDTVSLICQLDLSLTWSAASSRSMSGPPNLTPLITNGISTDTNKYEEVIDSTNRRFTMQIKNFNYTDLDDYKCSYLFDTSSALTLAADKNLEDPPKKVTKEENLEADGTTTLKYTLYQVRPQPNITVTVNDNPPPSSDISMKEQMTLNLDNNNYTYDAEFTVEISSLKGTDVVKVLIQAGEYTYNRTIYIPGDTTTTDAQTTASDLSSSSSTEISSTNVNSVFLSTTAYVNTTEHSTTEVLLSTIIFRPTNSSDDSTDEKIRIIIISSISGCFALAIIVGLLICSCIMKRRKMRNKNKNHTGQEQEITNFREEFDYYARTGSQQTRIKSGQQAPQRNHNEVQQRYERQYPHSNGNGQNNNTYGISLQRPEYYPSDYSHRNRPQHINDHIPKIYHGTQTYAF